MLDVTELKVNEGAAAAAEEAGASPVTNPNPLEAEAG